MTKISRQEVLKIAQISAISLQEHEIEPLITQLEEVLSYAARVKEIAASQELSSDKNSHKNVNIMRQDKVVIQDPESILAQAPERAGNYFVVPMILDN